MCSNEAPLRDFEIKYDSSQLKGLQLRQSASVILDVTIFPIVDSEGKITNAVIQHMDVTQRKMAEEALLESEEKYRSVVENMQDVFYRTDLQGKITMVSPSGLEMIGYESIDQIVLLNVARDFYKNPEERDSLLVPLPRERQSAQLRSGVGKKGRKLHYSIHEQPHLL